MIGGRRARIAAVIRRDHEYILIPQRGKQPRQALIKIGERLRVALHIIAVSVEHIVVYQIRKTQPVKIPLHIFQRPVDSVLVARRAYIFRDALLRKNVDDLSDGKYVKACGVKLI